MSADSITDNILISIATPCKNLVNLETDLSFAKLCMRCMVFTMYKFVNTEG